MPRGQDSLAIDVAHLGWAGSHAAPAIDLTAFELLVIEPSDDELAAHAAVLADLDKASGGRTLWRERMA
jgi:DNA polymerase-3 subunit epsilon